MAVFILPESMMASEERMRLSPEETNFKRRMKTPVQLEALERVYAGAVTLHTFCCLYVCCVAMYVDSTLCIFWSLCSHGLILTFRTLCNLVLKSIEFSQVCGGAEDRYPVESVRAELSAQLNLSDKQLQMWFCHRRLKDRKGKDEASSTPSVSRKKAKVDNSTVFQYPQAVLASDTGDAVLSGDHYGQQYLYEGLQHFTPEVSLKAGQISWQVFTY